MKKTVSTILVLCLLFGLPACGGKTGQGAWRVEENTLPLPVDMTAATAQCLIGGTVYVGGVGEDGAALGCVRLEDGEAKHFALPDTYEFIYALCEAGGALAVLAGTYPYAYYDAGGELHLRDESAGQMTLLLFDREGAFLGKTPLAQLYPGESGAFSQILYADGGYILMSRKMLVRLDAEGNETARFSAEDEAQFASMCAAEDALIVAACILNESASILYRFEGVLEPVWELALADTTVQGIGMAGDGRLILSETSNATVRLLDMETGEKEALFNADVLGFRGGFSALWSLDDGYLLFNTYQNKISTVKNIYVEENGKKVLLLATNTGSAELYTLVKDFNKENDEYQISVIEYGNSSTDRTRLITEITVGKGPDLFYLTGVEPFVDLNKLGVDLFPYLDSDPEFGRDTLVTPLLSALSKSGQLHSLPVSFGIITFLGAESLFGGSDVTLEKLEQVVSQQDEEMRVFPAWLGTFGWMARFSADKFVDRESGTCNFTNDEFMGLLEMCGEYGRTEEEYDMEPTLLSLEILRDVGRLASIKNYYNNGSGDYCFTGFPGAEGNGSMFFLEQCFGISRTCKAPDAAWRFVRMALTDDLQSTAVGFPAVNAELEKEISAVKLKGEGDEYTLERSDIEKLWSLINDTTVMMNTDSTVTDIISEEADDYLSGKSTLEEAAEFIQSRVSLYLAEQS